MTSLLFIGLWVLFAGLSVYAGFWCAGFVRAFGPAFRSAYRKARQWPS